MASRRSSTFALTSRPALRILGPCVGSSQRFAAAVIGRRSCAAADRASAGHVAPARTWSDQAAGAAAKPSYRSSCSTGAEREMLNCSHGVNRHRRGISFSGVRPTRAPSGERSRWSMREGCRNSDAGQVTSMILARVTNTRSARFAPIFRR